MNRKLLVTALVSGAAVAAAAVPAAAQGAGPYQFHSLTPCRIVDTRLTGTTIGTYGPKLQSGVEKQFPVQGNCGVPVGATAVTVNVTIAGPTGQGRLTVYPSGIATPSVSTINFPAGSSALANGAIVPLSAGVSCPAFTPNTCDFAVMPFVLSNGQVNMILDVTGYFAAP
jgi:hypothetical protein